MYSIDDFIAYMAFGENDISGEAKLYYEMATQNDYAVQHNESTGEWYIPEKTRFRKAFFHGVFDKVNYELYGTPRMDMLYILESTLNMKTLTISDVIEGGDNTSKSKSRIVNQQATVAVIERQQFMIETFKKWV